MQQVISENKRICCTKMLQDMGHDGTLLRNKKICSKIAQWSKILRQKHGHKIDSDLFCPRAPGAKFLLQSLFFCCIAWKNSFGTRWDTSVFFMRMQQGPRLDI